MAESTLSLAYTKLKASAGLFLGYGRGATEGDAAWSTRVSALLDEIVKSGLRQFYFPPLTEKGGESYEWSFLRPTADLTLAADARSLLLPDDFGGFDGALAVADESGPHAPVEITSMGRIRQMHVEYVTTTGRPQWAAVEPVKGTTLTKGQRYTLEVYPTADQEYTLRGAYFLLPDALSGDRPYAYGGAAHAETIEAAIHAAAELKLDDIKGPRWQYFMERLAASISQDRKLKPMALGYNGDRSNAKHRGGGGRGSFSVTVNGSTP